jgi:serine protease Do
MQRKTSLLVLAVALAVTVHYPLPTAHCQQRARPGEFVPKNSDRFLEAFREPAARPGQSTVRVRCGERDVALGTVVGADGWILTKSSELTGPATVRLADGTDLDARVVGVHEGHDLALLKVEAKKLIPVEWRPSKEVPVGYWAISVAPGGVPAAVGVVSVGTRSVDLRKSGWKPNPSGGFLGISLDPSSEKVARITQVMPGGGAARAGLKENDTIVSIAGKNVSHTEMLLKVLQNHKPGEEIALRIKRGDEELELKAKLGKRPLDRAEVQNSLGSELSKRRDGFPTILQHDGVVRPNECGGPLVDLDGKAIGINVARAGRTESYAVPTEVLLPLIRDMKAGHLPPRPRDAETASK